MDYVLILLGFVCILTGVIGSVVPALPGPPISWVGLLLVGLSPWVENSTALIVITGVIAVIITVLDYIIPSLATKHFGGSKYGIRGVT